MALKLPRTLRFDASDTFVYSHAAAPGEWAVTGTFMFIGVEPDALNGKDREAFRGGFLGIDSFGWSTLVVVTEATAAERAAAVERLAEQLVTHCGAPDLQTALPAAEEEVAFAQSLCNHPCGTLLALHRMSEDTLIRESFRTLRPKPDQPGMTIAFDPESDAMEDVDIRTLAERHR